MSSAQFLRVMKIYGIYRYIDYCVGGDRSYERKVHIMSRYSKSVSLFASEVLICEEYLEVNAFWNNKYQT